jgi:perosamine synthetase
MPRNLPNPYLESQRIPVAAPVLDGRETEYVMECLSTTWISSSGRFISEFEMAFARYCGARHAIAVNNGTTALHLSLVALGIGPGDEVIVPSLTYIASANAVRYCNAVPVFADSDLSTFNVSPDRIAEKISPRTRAIMPVHLYGHPTDMDPILEIANAHDLFVIEDAAEAVGAKYKGHPVGAIGTCGTFSFFGNKIITTGEGGMIVTNSDTLAEKMKVLRGQGMDPERRYWFPIIGYNYRMTNIAAAIGLAQLERVEHHLARRKHIAAAYNRYLAPLENQITLPTTELWGDHVFWMYTIVLRDNVTKSRDTIMHDLDLSGIETRPVFYPMHIMPPYYEPNASYPNADLLSARGISLPTHGRLTNSDIQRIASALEAALR